MIRRFNYTERSRLEHKHIRIELFEDTESGYPAFKASVDMSPYEFPSWARVYIEAYRNLSMMRFDYGTVNETAAYASREHLLNDLQSNNPQFRVKVVDERDDMGRLLAVADNVRAHTDDYKPVAKLPLLHVKFSDERMHRIWQLDINDAYDMPQLLVNNTLDINRPINEVIRTNRLFISLVFPQVVEHIMNAVLFHPDAEDIDLTSQYDWRALWVQYAMSLTRNYTDIHSLSDLNDSEKQEWIQQTVDRFCKRQNIVETFTLGLKEMTE